jgi:hypothetical protein
MPNIPSRAFALVVVAALAGAGGCTTPDADETRGTRERRSCFLPSQVSGFTPVGRDVVDVRVGASRVFRLELLGTCQNVDWAQRIGTRSRGGGSWVCQGLDAEIISPEPGGPRTCPVRSVRELSREEIEAGRATRN